MITCLAKSCLFGLLCLSFVGVCQILYGSFFSSFGIEGRMWDVIVLIPDRSIYFSRLHSIYLMQGNAFIDTWDQGIITHSGYLR